jgi:hypothetical protein
LSISSMKTMPFCSAEASAFALMSSSLTSFAASSSVSWRSGLGDRHLLLLAPAAAHLREHALDLAREVLHAGGAMISICGGSAATSTRPPCRRARLRAASCGSSGASSNRSDCMSSKFTSRARRQQHVEHALLGGIRRAVAHLARLGLARLLDRRPRRGRG